MSSTRLLVLGVVSVKQPVHGYDVRRELLSWRADEWAHVNPGSIYHALKTATRDGLLRVVDPPEVSRPEKTAYRLTEDGEAEFFRLLRESLWQLTKSQLPLRAALCFFTLLDREELVAMLTSRIAQLDAAVESMGLVTGRTVKPKHVTEQFLLNVAELAAQADWARGFVKRLGQGEYATAAQAPPW